MQWAFIIILIVHMRANIDRDMAGRKMCVFLTMVKTLVKNKKPHHTPKSFYFIHHDKLKKNTQSQCLHKAGYISMTIIPLTTYEHSFHKYIEQTIKLDHQMVVISGYMEMKGQSKSRLWSIVLLFR